MIITAFKTNKIVFLLLLAIFFSATYLLTPSLKWIFQQLISNRFELIVLAIVVLLIISKIFTHHAALLDQHFHLNPIAMSVFALSIIGYFVSQTWIAINLLSALFTLSALYGFLGFFVNHQRWHLNCPVFILLCLLLPFANYLEVYLGFPLRFFAAEQASGLITLFGFETISTETVIKFDNQVANVDVSCSGIKGLWAGSLFYILITWIEKKALSLSWLVGLIVFIALIIVANILRITILVCIVFVFDNNELALLVHSGMGLLFFSFACIGGWFILRVLKNADTNTQRSSGRVLSIQPLIGLLLFLLTLVSLFKPLEKPILDKEYNTPLNFKPSWQAVKTALSSEEVEFFPRQGATAQKYNFNWQPSIEKNEQQPLINKPLVGSLVVVDTYYWKAHHDPKTCFLAQGFKLNGEDVIKISNDFLVKKLLLQKANHSYIAFYWFQSETKKTADFSSRMFEGLFYPRARWTMTSVLLEAEPKIQNNYAMLAKELQAIISTHYQSAPTKKLSTDVREKNEF